MKRTHAAVLILVLLPRLPGSAWAGDRPSRHDAFRDACESVASEASKQGRSVVCGRAGWFFLVSELRHLTVGEFWGEQALKVSKAVKPEWADPLPAIVDFNEQLNKRGIKLILLPVPPKAAIHPEGLNAALALGALPGGPRLDTRLQHFYSVLGKQGVEVIDLADEFLNAMQKEPAKILYCRTDTHWSPAACALAARILKEKIPADKRPEPKVKYAFAPKELKLTGDLSQLPGGEKAGEERINARCAVTAEGLPAETEDRQSPILLMGDSHCLVFHIPEFYGPGAGLADYLAEELGHPVDVLGVRGSGATAVRLSLLQRMQATEGYLQGKRVVIWCFAAKEFTEAQGWRKVPLGK